MHIELIPIRMDATLEAHLAGEVLTLNGQAVDLSAVTEAEPLAAETLGCPWICGEVTRRDGEIRLSLLLPHGADAPEEMRFPAPISRRRTGPLPLPCPPAEPADEPPAEI
ncbi:MAG: hypothetical protein R3D63_03995 [Paracoccaceae bacterium]